MQINKNHKRVLNLVQTAILVAIMLILEITGLGMIRIGPLEMTIMQFPVIVGALLMGPLAGTGLGCVFGLISFWECFGKSAFGTSLMGIDPFYTFLVCVPTRTLMGLLCGICFRLLQRWMSGWKHQNKVVQTIPYAASSLFGALMNTVLFMGALILLFSQTEYIQGFIQMSGTSNMFAFVCWFVGVQGLVEALLCAFLGTVISRSVKAIVK